MSDSIQRLRTGAASKQSTGTASGQKVGVTSFATAEEAIRADQATVDVPARVRERLAASAVETAPAVKPWWKRLFGG